jgi:serine/threonine protein kinase
MTERPASPTVGGTLGRYRIESLLGRGGMGAVYLATHDHLDRRVALKVIATDLALNEDFRTRFLRESQLAASLDHPNVIPIYDAGEVDGVLYLAMRYASGPSLQTLIRERGHLSPARTLEIAAQIGGALDAAHRAGLVHRDVKPANILLAEPERHAYLCDFGLAKRTSSSGVTQTGSFLGTVDYCSPEQIEGRSLDGRSDVYSLGCVLFECLTGGPPYERDSDFAVLQAHLTDPPPSLAAVGGDLPGALDRVIATATAKDPDDRFTTAGALASTFASALGAGPTRAAPAIPVAGEAETRVLPQRPRLPKPSRRWLAAALAAAVVVAAGVSALAIRGSDGASSAPDPTSARLRTFVDRIENVLEQSAAGRDEVSAALTGGLDCSIAPQVAGARVASVADNRQSILLQLGGLQTPTEQADEVVTLLQRSLQQSIEADRHYRDGFFALAESESECPLQRNADFELAGASSARATAAKKRFVAAFNPLAERFGERTWTAAEI